LLFAVFVVFVVCFNYDDVVVESGLVGAFGEWCGPDWAINYNDFHTTRCLCREISKVNRIYLMIGKTIIPVICYFTLHQPIMG
jgi:hypothetical protein